MPYRGVTAVPLRRVCRAVFDGHPLPDRAAWESCVRELWDGAAYREERYAAIALTGHRAYRHYQDPATLGLYRHMIETGEWWDFVDSIASRNVGGILTSHPGEVTPVMTRWAVDDDMWVRRTAILCQLLRKEDTDVELLRHCIEANLEDSRHGREFFVRKAVGWALRQHARVDPEWVRGFVARHGTELSGLSKREALRHL